MNFAILLLGGNGNRLKSELPKQFIKINEKEVFLYSYEIFLNHPDVDKIILVTLKEFIPFVKEKVNLKNQKTYLISKRKAPGPIVNFRESSLGVLPNECSTFTEGT